MSAKLDLLKPVIIGGDHAGFEYKRVLIEWLREKGLTVVDKGLFEDKSVDYPDYAHPVADEVEKGASAFGILICGSANGVAITANKHQGIRAGLSWIPEVARLIRQHNDANIICIPARFADVELAKEMIQLFMDTEFEGGRHATRVGKISCR
jgi:ribose 5-phosphate isomerase B